MKLIIFFISLVTLSACSIGKPSESSDIESALTETSEETVALPEDNVEMIISALEEGYSDFANVTYSDNNATFHLKPKEGHSETETLKKIANNPNEKKHEETIKDGAEALVDMSIMIKENIADGISIQLDNPYEGKNPLFIITDGKIAYPILK
ncbi:hypothetical protein [Jeotgalibaca porci]|uniref:hypothetical protein n=1 Tax=Jeotgalibaca porci TaxID=1868793 RepID=UPI0035A19A83